MLSSLLVLSNDWNYVFAYDASVCAMAAFLVPPFCDVLWWALFCLSKLIFWLVRVGWDGMDLIDSCQIKSDRCVINGGENTSINGRENTSLVQY